MWLRQAQDEREWTLHHPMVEESVTRPETGPVDITGVKGTIVPDGGELLLTVELIRTVPDGVGGVNETGAGATGVATGGDAIRDIQ